MNACRNILLMLLMLPPMDTLASSEIDMQSRSYVGLGYDDLEPRGIRISGTKSSLNSTEFLHQISFSITATNVAAITLNIATTHDDGDGMNSTWRADRNHICWASFSIGHNMLPKARLYFDMDGEALHGSAHQGFFFDLQNYTHWDYMTIEIDMEDGEQREPTGDATARPGPTPDVRLKK